MSKANVDNKSPGGNKAPKKQALGRGLGSLLGIDEPEEPKEIELPKSDDFEASKTPALREGFQESKETKKEPQIPRDKRIWTIAIEDIFPNKKQPRTEFSADELKELADSIRVQGILQPLVARTLPDGKYQIIAGERRWRASQLAGLKEVPVIIKDTDDQKALELALIENIQRQDLNPVEEAEAYAQLINDYNLTQQQVAEKVGKDRATVANLLRLLNLTKEVRDKIVTGELSLGIAKLLLSVTDPKKQKRFAGVIVKKGLTVRAAETLIKKDRDQQLSTDSPSPSVEADVAQSMVRRMQEELQKALGTKVAIDYKLGKGKISVHYYSDDEFNNIIDRLKG